MALSEEAMSYLEEHIPELANVSGTCYGSRRVF